MQTRFTEEQLRNPRIAEADGILRTCVHCGFCTATCPTYVLLGDERDSPRGRIYLIKEMFEQDRAANAEVTTHIDRCLSCLSCVTTCPSGVDYMHLVDMARQHIHETGPRSPRDRWLRRTLARVLPYPDRFRMSLRAAMLGRYFAGLFARAGFKEVAAMLRLAPKGLPGKPKRSAPQVITPDEGATRRVVLLQGCAQQVLRPELNEATIRLLNRHGVEVILAEGEGCCGALVHHLGFEDDAKTAAQANVDAWSVHMRHAPLDAIVVNASGCGTMVKDYGHLLARDQGYGERAAALSQITRDITEFLNDIEPLMPENLSGLKVAYHSACSMQHGQRITLAPKTLLRNAGFTVVDVPEGHLCCGSAGTYNILQPELAGELKARKLANIATTKPDVVATGNIGCIAQLQAGCPVPVVHTVELLDWATGGPCPKELKQFAPRVRRVGDLAHTEAAE